MKRYISGMAVIGWLLSGAPRALALTVIFVTQPAPDTNPQSAGIPGSSSYSFNQSSGPFVADFDDNYAGETSYNYTGHLTNGDAIISSNPNSGTLFNNSFFSPSLNSSGAFVGFLGNDATGNGTDTTVAPTTVAQIIDSVTGGAVGYIQADYGATTPEDTTFTIVDTSAFGFDPPQFDALPPLGGPALPEPAATPEPATLALLGMGVLGLAGYGWRRRYQSAA